MAFFVVYLPIELGSDYALFHNQAARDRAAPHVCKSGEVLGIWEYGGPNSDHSSWVIVAVVATT